MDWGVGPGGRERFAQALLTFAFFAPADAALAALGPVRIFPAPRPSGEDRIVRNPAPIGRAWHAGARLTRSRAADTGLGAMESAPQPSAP
jgi:hypothetical protein